MNTSKLEEIFPKVKVDLCMQIERDFLLYRQGEQEDSYLMGENEVSCKERIL